MLNEMGAYFFSFFLPDLFASGRIPMGLAESNTAFKQGVTWII